MSRSVSCDQFNLSVSSYVSAFCPKRVTLY